MFWDAQLIVPTALPGGGDTIFYFASAPRILLLFRNGLLQTPGAGNDFIQSGPQITFTTAPLAGDDLIALVGW